MRDFSSSDQTSPEAGITLSCGAAAPLFTERLFLRAFTTSISFWYTILKVILEITTRPHNDARKPLPIVTKGAENVTTSVHTNHKSKREPARNFSFLGPSLSRQQCKTGDRKHEMRPTTRPHAAWPLLSQDAMLKMQAILKTNDEKKSTVNNFKFVFLAASASYW